MTLEFSRPRNVRYGAKAVKKAVWRAAAGSGPVIVMERSSGVLLPMFSLPSAYGIGTLGRCAFEFIDFLKSAGQKYWQLLPLGPTDLGDSPYSSPSAFAGNPYLIDLEALIEDGLLEKSEAESVDWGPDPESVCYESMLENRLDVLRKAYGRRNLVPREELDGFCRANSSWLDNYSLYMALKVRFGGKAWTEWPDDIRRRSEEAVRRYASELSAETGFWKFIQYLFFSQWDRLRAYAKENGISFIGDIPIYVAMDSADIWSEPWFFQLDENCVPKEVAGCPPDAFTDEGQLWGNPLYDYGRMKADGFGWWIRRIEGASRLYDVIRIDHFRGFDSYWAVPYGEKTAKNGHWREGPGMALVGVLTSWFSNLSFIAEDLGCYTPGVARLLSDSGLPGMKILQFAFDSESESSYLPHCCQFNSCCYTGTHDNDTIPGWLETLSEDDREFARCYMNIREDEGWCWGMIRTGMSTSSNLFVMQMQDLLELPGRARTNMPGVPSGYWRWRMLPGAADEALALRLREMTGTYRRLNRA